MDRSLKLSFGTQCFCRPEFPPTFYEVIILTISDKVNQLLRIRNHIIIPQHDIKRGYDANYPVNELDKVINLLYLRKKFAGDLL